SRSEREALPAPSMVSFPLDIPIPVQKAHVCSQHGIDARLADDEGRIWVYRASNVQADWAGRSKHWVRKKADTKAMMRWSADGTANISLGPLKNGNASYNTMWPRDGALWWYAVADPDSTRALLRRITHLGKFRNHGMGKVRKNASGHPGWVVEDAPEDWSMIDADGNVNRAIPVPSTHTGPSRVLGIRPPYHHASRRARCYLTGVPK